VEEILLRNPAVLGLGAFALLLPMSIEVPAARDSAGPGGETRVAVFGGRGHYAIIDRGCEGQVLRTHPREFHEVAGELQHRFPSGLTVGIRGGTLHGTSRTTVEDYSTYPERETVSVQRFSNRYINPSVAIEAQAAGIGGGWITAQKPYDDGAGGSHRIDPSGHIRLGRLDGLYFKVAYLESAPLYSGGGFVEIGIGSHPTRLFDMYGGLSGGPPYDGLGLSLRVEYRALEHYALSARGRLGDSGGEPQSGLALGVAYVSSTPRDPPHHEPRAASGVGSSAWGLGPRPPKAEPKRRSRSSPPADTVKAAPGDSLPEPP
jgi:hypothetical protein